jgi:hypothetical protein
VLALSIVGLIAGNFAEGKKPIGIKHLSDAMGLKPEIIKPVLDNLCEKNIVYASEPDKVYLLSVAPDKLLTSIRTHDLKKGTGVTLLLSGHCTRCSETQKFLKGRRG